MQGALLDVYFNLQLCCFEEWVNWTEAHKKLTRTIAASQMMSINAWTTKLWSKFKIYKGLTQFGVIIKYYELINCFKKVWKCSMFLIANKIALEICDFALNLHCSGRRRMNENNQFKINVYISYRFSMFPWVDRAWLAFDPLPSLLRIVISQNSVCLCVCVIINHGFLGIDVSIALFRSNRYFEKWFCIVDNAMNTRKT